MTTKARGTTRRRSASGVLALDRPENVKAVEEREPLFSIGGVEYSILKDPPASLAIRVLETATTVSVEAANGLMAMEVLGEKSYTALRDCKTLTRQDFQTIVKAIEKKVFPNGLGKALGAQGTGSTS